MAKDCGVETDAKWRPPVERPGGPDEAKNENRMRSLLITSLKMDRFRKFQSLELKDLRRLNLVFGGNNSGKTSVLEAIHLVRDPRLDYLGGPGPLRHKTQLIPSRWRPSYVDSALSWFYHTGIGPAAQGAVETSEAGDVANICVDGDCIQIAYEYTVVDMPIGLMEGFPAHRSKTDDDFDDSQVVPARVVKLSLLFNDKLMSTVYYSDLQSHPRALSRSKAGQYLAQSLGLKDARDLYQSATQTNFSVAGSSPVETFSAFDGGENLIPLWSKLVRDNLEDEALRILREFHPNLQRIALMEYHNRTSIFAKLGEDWIPVDALGHGMRRSMALIGLLLRAADGILLIDELDAGLHPWVIPQMVDTIDNLSRRFKVQIFISTHSLDIIDAFARIASRFDDELASYQLQGFGDMARVKRLAQRDLVKLRLEYGREVRG